MVKTVLIFIITVTMYNNDPKQTDSTPNKTAFHREYGDNKHDCLVHRCGVAVGRILKDSGFHHGCRVYISGILVRDYRLDGTDYCNGLYVVNDVMNGRYNWNVDIFDFNYDRAIQFGVQKGTIQLLWCE